MTPRAFSYAAGVAFTASAAVCWSLGGGLVRLTDGIDVWQIAFFRSWTVLVFISLWLFFRFRGELFHHIARAGANGVIAGIFIGTAGFSYVASLFYITVAEAIFMAGLAPFMTALLGMWILRERVPAITWFAMTVALAGMAVMFIGTGSGSGAIFGITLAIFSTYCVSCYAVLLRWGQKTEMSVALIWNALFLILLGGAVLLLPTSLRAAQGLDAFAIGWWNFGIVAVMGVVQLTLGVILFTIGSRSVPAAQLSLITLIEPTLSPFWAWLAVGELPPVWTFIGGAVILLAIVIQALHGATRNNSHARSRRRRQPA